LIEGLRRAQEKYEKEVASRLETGTLQNFGRRRTSEALQVTARRPLWSRWIATAADTEGWVEGAVVVVSLDERIGQLDSGQHRCQPPMPDCTA